MPAPVQHLASDTGGTFTDLVASDGRILKVPSTPDDPGAAVREGVERLAGATRPELLGHGTTVGTNALLERRGATVALVMNEGFADVIEIGRQDRPSLYDQTADRPEPLVARRHRFEVRGRLDAAGREIEALDLATLPALPDLLDGGQVNAVAICLLHADLEPAHERAVAERLRADGIDVSASHEVSPEFRELERTVTTVVDGYLRPRCRDYLAGLAGLADEVVVMTSAGGLVPAEAAAEHPVSLLLSGPAGGVLAGAAAAVANGWPDAVTFDMGGTSTDVCLVVDGRPAPAGDRVVGGFALRSPSLDVHTIGAGGGSIARVDAGGALVVGPRSAGAVPGPACYGLGGTEATVTDADLVAGRIPADTVLPGLGPVDLSAARAALEHLGVRAEAVLSVVDAAMELAVRRVSIERGVDPRGLALVAFGGAGPLHACTLAESLGMPAVIVPARAGVLSAVGVLGAPRQVDLVESCPDPLDHADAERRAAALVERASASLGRTDSVEVAFDCRYAGQSHELRVESIAGFPSEHERRNGYARPGVPVEVTAVRAVARRASPIDPATLPPPDRHAVDGPAVVAEADCTIWVPDGWQARPGVGGALVLTRSSSRSNA